MGTLGRNVENYASGYDDSIIAGADSQWLMYGASIDWSLVPAVSVDTTLTSGRIIRAGQQYLRHGQFMTRITGAAGSVGTLNNTPTGGTFTVTVTTPAGGSATTSALAYNATGATVATAVQALPNVGTTVTGTAGSTYVVSLPASLPTAVLAINPASLTGGTATLAANTISVTATGGTFTISVTAGGTTSTTSGLAYNATLSTVQAAINALTSIAATVSGSGGGPYTFGFPAAFGTASVSGSGASLTGSGAQPTITFAQSSNGRIGWFGPYDPAAADGRATIQRGDCGLLERTVVNGGSLGLNTSDDVHKGLVTGGHVWLGAVIQSGVGSHSLAAGPTRAELEAAMPTLTLKARFP